VAEIPPNSADIENWLRLIRSDDVGPVTFVKLLTHFGSADKALGASSAQLERIDGIGPKTANAIASGRNKFDTKAELNLAARLGVWIINLRDNRYPPVLKKIYDPPPVLYIKGSLTKADNLAISIVGSRLCSAYGREQAARFAHLLASAGFTICSGMARGIDSDAHYGALSERASEKIEPNLFDIEQLKLSTTEKAVYHCLNREPLHIEQIIAQTGIHASNINSSLISLQLKGVIKQQPGSFFLRR